MNQSNARVVKQTAWQTVCQVSDLVADSGVVVWHDGQQVALFYLPGQGPELYAVGNRDPRSGANVIGRGLVGNLQGEPVVAAPLYKQHFCLHSGRCLEDAQQALPVWAVRISEGRVEIGSGAWSR
ncbi:MULTISPECIES: nitrite reductase small subunit NirD [Pseudomonas]|jgi:nitrite reductase (NADH) small subunit|uniref:Nitrite reductase small subunit NirD n=1 Tax=Pseudomonas mosselii TaxID=78327 RepID=A0A5R8Z643_9PSED|nr:nitrite reductase small subunit NirD [Pseudomonas mosselii]TLP61239.1 nitrite reductase small subunit NirD [Pseudomonas mosselii]